MRSVRQPLPHDSAVLHVTGEARYVDDLPVLPGTLFCWAVLSDRAHARMISVELEKARQIAGVRATLTGADLPPDLRIGPVIADEEGQPPTGRVQAILRQILRRLIDEFFDLGPVNGAEQIVDLGLVRLRLQRCHHLPALLPL